MLKKILLTSAIVIIAANMFLGFVRYRFEVHTMWAKAYKNANRHLDVIKEVNAGKSRFITLDMTGNPLEWYSSVAYQGLKQYDKALEQATIAQQYHPNSARIMNTIGNIYVETSQFDKAIEYYEKALKIIPNYEIVQKNLAYNYYNVGRYTDAIETFEKINLEGDEYSKEILRTCQKRSAQ
jgi:tetratricopeptide (TPR) repeat protein